MVSFTSLVTLVSCGRMGAFFVSDEDATTRPLCVSRGFSARVVEFIGGLTKDARCLIFRRRGSKIEVQSFTRPSRQEARRGFLLGTVTLAPGKPMEVDRSIPARVYLSTAQRVLRVDDGQPLRRVLIWSQDPVMTSRVNHNHTI